MRRLPARRPGARGRTGVRGRGAALTLARATASFRDLALRGFYSAVDDRLGGFYVPLLERAVAYDRVTGYFRSSSLAVAAAGLSHFIANGGTVRLIAGAELAEDDLRAITEGQPLSDVLARRLLTDPLAGADIVTKHRLEVLAYLVREGRLQIKIGVPTDHLGRPLRPAESSRYFHSKFGVLTDAIGQQVAFIGSDNESASGWRANHESFTVAKSWMDQVWSEQGAPLCRRFEDHWSGRPDQGWAVIDLPEAVEERLVAHAKDDPPPVRDPAEARRDGDDARERELLRFVAAAPRIGGGSGVGFATAGVNPWPHQSATATQAVDSYPRGYLLADEVGLGKTIEAGLILRELLASGRAQHALLLVPASVLRQWQEELFEKFALAVPRLEGGAFLGPGDVQLDAPAGSPWRAFPVLLASSHLARRRDRCDEVLAAAPWDVVLVDEAHHARREGGKPDGRPNALLALLQAMRANGAWRALYLASATPMQMHPHEAWDLLELLGLPGRWGEGAAPFVRYFSQLREADFPARDWAFLERMSADFFADPEVGPDRELESAVKHSLNLAGSRPIRSFDRDGLSPAAARELSHEARPWMDAWLRAHTPMRERVFRSTRQLLRQYKADGLLPADVNVPARIVRDRFVPMTPDERRLYDRIETYISRYYNAYTAAAGAQRALGFIMTVYRRRLTSSFLAIERSLHRRLDGLLDHASAGSMLDADDVVALEASGALEVAGLERPSQELADEVAELRTFLDELAERPPDESKMERLHDELDDAFRGAHDTAIVFTQYTDTMDYLREQLLSSYGAKVACYSGRGGERWDPASATWKPLAKEELKRLFREGREVKVLLGTDSLSEGLNLQTCAKLVNYDMPWNFMRVEQRIGRVDRIGGQPVVEVSNYFYQGTVEEHIYRGIGEDYDWFQDVVGPAQPVLGQVERAIEDVALEAPGETRTGHVAARAEALRRQIEAAGEQPISVADLESAPTLPASTTKPAITLAGLERVLTGARATAACFELHPEIDGAYVLDLRGRKVEVTFRRDVLDAFAPGVRLLSYLTPELEELLLLAGVETTEALDAAGDFRLDGAVVRSLEELEGLLEPA